MLALDPSKIFREHPNPRQYMIDVIMLTVRTLKPIEYDALGPEVIENEVVLIEQILWDLCSGDLDIYTDVPSSTERVNKALNARRRTIEARRIIKTS